jgi:hypothetical protein
MVPSTRDFYYWRRGVKATIERHRRQGKARQRERQQQQRILQQKGPNSIVGGELCVYRRCSSIGRRGRPSSGVGELVEGERLVGLAPEKAQSRPGVGSELCCRELDQRCPGAAWALGTNKALGSD